MYIQKKEKNRLLVFIETQAALGGGQKRYINVARMILERDSRTHVLLNDTLFSEFKSIGLIDDHPNLHIVKLKKKPRSKLKNHDAAIEKVTNQGKNKLYFYLGRVNHLRKTLVSWVQFSAQFIQLYRTLRIKSVYSIWQGTMFLWPWKLLLNFYWVCTFNDSTASNLKTGIAYWFRSEYMGLRYSDKIDLLGAMIRPRLEQSMGKFSDEKISISPSSFVDINLYRPNSEKEFDTIFLSRLTHWKSPMLYLEAIAYLNENFDPNKSLKHLVLGTGDLENDMMEFAKAYGLSNVFFMGATSNPQDYLSKSKVFLSIQKLENYPSQSLLEAMSCENAIIASDVGETRKLVDETVGCLVNLNHIQIADSIHNLLQNDSLRCEMGKNARRRVEEHYNPKRFMDYFDKIF